MDLQLIEDNIQDTRSILAQLDLHQDQSFMQAISSIEIEYSGMLVNCSTKHLESLNKIHADNIQKSLYDIVQNALGYYALVDQPVGTNEPPIGPIFAQQLIANIQKGEVNLMETKNVLFRQIYKEA